MTGNNESNLVFPSNNALRLDGIDDRVALRNANQLGLNGDFTVEAWVNINEFPSGQLDHPILGTDQRETNQGLHLTIRNQRPFLGFFGDNNDLQGNTVLQPNTWYHITYRYTASNRQQAIFVNGRLDSTRTTTANFQGTGLVNIGRSSNDRYFNGSIDELRIWNKARTQAEIQSTLYQSLTGSEANLQGYYTFDNVSNVIVDRTTNGNNGTLIDNRNFLPSKQESFGNALSLNGIDNRVTLGNPSNLNIIGQITLEAWINLDRTDSLRNIIARGYDFNPNGEVFLRINDGFYEIGSWTGQGVAARFAIPSSDIGQWTHLAGVYDGNRWRLYRNGIEVASSAITSQGAVSVNQGWAIGSRGDGTERYFSGQIDEVRIWNRGLNQQEIQANLNNTLTGTEANLVGYYNFDYNGIVDKTNKNNNASLVNGADVEPTTPPPQPSGNVLSLDGVDDRVTLGNPSKLNIIGQITLEAWIKPSRVDSVRNIVARGFGSNSEVFLRIFDNSTVSLIDRNIYYEIGSSVGATGLLHVFECLHPI